MGRKSAIAICSQVIFSQDTNFWSSSVNPTRIFFPIAVLIQTDPLHLSIQDLVVFVFDVFVLDLLVVQPAKHGIPEVAVDKPQEGEHCCLGNPNPHADRDPFIEARAGRVVALQAHNQHAHDEKGALSENCQDTGETRDDQALSSWGARDVSTFFRAQAVQKSSQGSRQKHGGSSWQKAHHLQSQEVVFAHRECAFRFRNSLYQSLIKHGDHEDDGSHPG